MGEVSWWTIPVPSLVILVSAVLVLLCGQTDRQTDRQTNIITEVDDRYSNATTVYYEPKRIMMLLMQELKFVQASMSCLQSVYLVVVTQLKRQSLSITRRLLNLSITRRVLTVASSYDPRLTFSVDTAKCSRIRSVNFVLEVSDLSPVSIQTHATHATQALALRVLRALCEK